MRNTKYVLYLLIIGTCQSSQITTLSNLPADILKIIETFNTYNEFEDFINTWQTHNFEIKEKNSEWNAKAIQVKIKKSVAIAYASSPLSLTSEDIYQKLKKINWKETFFTKECFIALWWRIPTVCLAYLCNDQQYITLQENYHTATTFKGDWLGTVYDKEQKQTFFTISSFIMNNWYKETMSSTLLQILGSTIYKAEKQIENNSEIVLIRIAFLTKEILDLIKKNKIPNMLDILIGQYFFQLDSNAKKNFNIHTIETIDQKLITIHMDPSLYQLITSCQLPDACPLSTNQRRFLERLIGLNSQSTIQENVNKSKKIGTAKANESHLNQNILLQLLKPTLTLLKRLITYIYKYLLSVCLFTKIKNKIKNIFL